MKQFVIQRKIEWKRADGSPVMDMAYFQGLSTLVFPVIELSNLEGAKKYNSRAEALIDWRKYFGGSDKRAKVIPYKPENA